MARIIINEKKYQECTFIQLIYMLKEIFNQMDNEFAENGAKVNTVMRLLKQKGVEVEIC